MTQAATGWANAAAGAGPARAAAVESARQRWSGSLIDYSRHNNLLYFRPLRLGTFELEQPNQLSLHQLIAGVRTLLSRLLPGQELIREVDEAALATRPETVSDEQLGVVRRLEEIRARAVENFEERGLETMCLAYGMATWPASDGGRPPVAPIVLIPVALEARGERMALQRRADPELNLALLHLLAEYGCPPVDERMVNELDDADTAGVGEILGRIVAAVSASAAHALPGFAVEPRAVIGNFSFERLAAVRDLGRLAGRMSASDVVAALAGDDEARRALSAGHRPLDPESLDGIDPDTEFLPLDTDSSQRAVVAEVLAGRTGVIAGPPGTGKSQTIACLIAELAAHGRSVLFVSAKSRALEVVRSRLEEVGLGQLLLDLHGGVTKREVMAQFAEAIELVRESTPVDATQQHREMTRRRELLVTHCRRMNRRVPPTDLSIHRLLGLLTGAPADHRSGLRFDAEVLGGLDPALIVEVEGLLTGEAKVEDLLFATNPSPWTRAQLLSDEEAARAHAAAVSLDRQWPALRQALEGVLGETRLRWPAHLAEASPLAEMVGVAGRLMETYTTALWELDLDETLTGISLGLGRGIAKAVTRMTYAQFRSAESRLLALRTGKRAAEAGNPDDIAPDLLHAEVLDAIRVRDVWRVDGEAGVTPRGAAWLPHLRAAVGAFEAALPDLQAAFPGGNFRDYPLQALPQLVAGLAEDAVTVKRVPLHCRTLRRLRELRLQPLLDLITAESRPPQRWVGTFDVALWQSTLDSAWAADPELGSFNGTTQEQLAGQFSRLDRDRLALAAARVRRAHAENAVATMNSRGDQHALVLQETAKRVDHTSVRRLLASAGEVLTALKPCWLASPLAVPQLLDGEREHFDVVVLDEASQLLVEEAVPALMRARSVVVCGDLQQLSPAPFLVAGEADTAVDGPLPSLGPGVSLLAAMTELTPPWPLGWHYRSRDERLVAFSNARLYRGAMVTFPAPRPETPLRLVSVDAGAPDADGRGQSSAAEVARTVELVRQHAAERPERSLMVVTMTRLHGRRVEAALRAAWKEDNDFFRWCDRTHVEPFAVRSADRVQGDERDDVILSLGWQKGALPAMLDPVAGDAGERLLNVATTRQRHTLTVVSTLEAQDVPGIAAGDAGLCALSDWLGFLAGGGVDPATKAPPVAAEPPEPDELERDVAAALRERGLPVSELLGSSRTRVEVALGHPEKPGTHVLALEGDGAPYAAAPTARDRDRLRRQQLESLGWSHTRLWGLEWYLRRQATLDRIADEHRAAVQRWEMRERGELETPAAPSAAAIVAAATPQRGERPPVPRGRQITDYTPQQIWQVMTWVLSDGRMRTDDEIVDETATELGFPKVDAWVDGPIRAVLRPS